MKNIQLLLFLLGFMLVDYGSYAQLVEQPDPLRPSASDSTEVNPAADSSRVGTGDQGEDEADQADTTLTSYRYRFTADGTITSGNVSRTLLQLTSAVDYQLSHYFKLSSNPSFVYGKQNGFLAEREWFGDLRTTFRHQ